MNAARFGEFRKRWIRSRTAALSATWPDGTKRTEELAGDMVRPVSYAGASGKVTNWWDFAALFGL